jgi:tetratricopeptide (TPR) repeat protein
MKAEHRHELKTNALADIMGRALQTIKAGPSRHGMLMTIVVAVAAAIALGGYLWWKDSQEAASALWVKVGDAERKLDNAANPDEIQGALKDFKKTADEHPGTPQARVLRFDRARTLLYQGMEHLCSPADREKALADIKEARDIYAKLAAEPAGKENPPALVQEAMMGVAKADESTGNLDDALKGYQKLAKAYPSSVLGKAAEERAKYLEDDNNRQQAKKLYEELDREVARSQPPPAESPEKK